MQISASPASIASTATDQQSATGANANMANGANFVAAAHSRNISEAIADYVLAPGWNQGTPEKICGNMVAAKAIVSDQLKQSAWQQERDQLQKDVQAALLKTYQFGTRQQQADNLAAYTRLQLKLAEHLQAGPQKYAGSFAPFMPDMDTCMGQRAADGDAR